jgi:hypothetical protein
VAKRQWERQLPEEHIRVEPYASLHQWLREFAQGNYPFLWVYGRPGLGKSQGIRAAVKKGLYVQGGKVSPLEFYRLCYKHRGEPIILDDGERLMNDDNKDGLRLVTTLTETDRIKTLHWKTVSQNRGEVPDEFRTSSPVCVISNQFTVDSALLSRAWLLHFDPNNSEIHRNAATWFWDQEIHDWIGQHHQRMKPLEARWYVKAAQAKEAGRHWQTLLLNLYSLDATDCVVQDLETSVAHPTKKDKLRAFTERTGNKRTNYEDRRQRLRDAGQLVLAPVLPIKVQGTRPAPRPTKEELQALDDGRISLPDLSGDAAARDNFVAPVTASPPPAPPRIVLDDSLPFDPRPQDDDGE